MRRGGWTDDRPQAAQRTRAEDQRAAVADQDEVAGRKGGKRAASLAAIRAAAGRGEVVHVARPGGMQCTEPGHCGLPAWDGQP